MGTSAIGQAIYGKTHARYVRLNIGLGYCARTAGVGRARSAAGYSTAPASAYKDILNGGVIVRIAAMYNYGDVGVPLTALRSRGSEASETGKVHRCVARRWWWWLMDY